MIEAKNFRGGGMDSDSNISDIAANDYLSCHNMRNTGTQSGEDGDEVSIEGTNVIFSNRPAGINKSLGGFGFETIRKAYAIISNSFGNWLLTEFDYDTLTETTLFENKTDSGGISLFDLDPQNYINDMKIVQSRYFIFTDSFGEPHYVDLELLRNKSFGVFIEEDFSLAKGQPLKEPTFVYGDDGRKTVNSLKNRLFQFREQFEKLNYERTAWGTISKRNVPIDEPTPAIGSDVTKANNLIISVDAGTTRDANIIVAGRYDLLDWFEIKNISRKTIVELPQATVNIDNEIYEAYDPITNIYSFAFYNDGNYTNIAPLETDLLYDSVPNRVNSLEILNGSILALAGIKEGYDRPIINLNLTVSAYNPDISVSAPIGGLYISEQSQYRDKRGFLHGTHSWYVTIGLGGQPKTGDKIFITVYNYIKPYSGTREYSLTVKSSENNNLQAILARLATIIPKSSINGNKIIFYTDSGFQLSSASLLLAGVGTGISKSISSLKTNSSYQLAFAEYDKNGTPYPIISDERFDIKTQSYAISKGFIPQISWDLLDSKPAKNAKSYQWLLTVNNTHETDLYVNGAYDESQSDADYMVFNIKSLQRFNTVNTSSVLSYDYSEGDRVTLAFTFLDTSTPIKWFDTPAIDLEVVSLKIEVDTTVSPNITNYFLKVRKSSALDIADITGKETLLEIYSPKKRVSISNGQTVNNSNLFFEIGERYDVVDGEFSVKKGVIKSGDVYFKNRTLSGGVDVNKSYALLVEDFNFSDFYKSDYTSYGRPRIYDDQIGETYREASIRYSDTFIKGSKINGLTRFYPERLYGDGDGQSSSSFGAIWKIRMRDNYLVVLQETKVGHIGISRSILEDLEERRQVAISDRLLNNITYLSGNYGIGTAKESYAESQNGTIYFADPNNSLPMRDGYDGLKKISGKKEKYFRTILKQAKKLSLKIIGYYDTFNDEYNLSIETKSGVLMQINFNNSDWIFEDNYLLTANTLFTLSNSLNGTTINNNDGTATFTPNNDYVGNGGFTLSFTDGTTISKNTCIDIEAGITAINQFYFVDLTGQELNTLINSNSILVFGNNIPVPISIVGGEYSVNGDAWTSLSGYVDSGDTVVVRRLSSETNDTQVNAVLTIGGVSDSFDILTKTFSIYPFKWVIDESTAYCITKNIVINDFDFLVARFLWDYPSAGTDLDIQVRYENNSTPSVDNIYVGFGGSAGGTVPASASPPESSSYLWWGLDDTNASSAPQGIEGVLISLKKFRDDFPTSPNIIEVDLYAVWFNSVATGDFTLEVKTYKGGIMSKVGTDIVNTGGTIVSTDTRALNTLIRNSTTNPATSYHIGSLKYNKTTNTAVLNII